MRFIRVCLGSESGEPGMTLYEINDDGWVHRQVQLYAKGARFAPEDILMCRPVNLEAMSRHPASEEIDREEFELLWVELQDSRPFLDRLPDPTRAWEGWLTLSHGAVELQWLPDGEPPRGWNPVPGFESLFVAGDARVARSACAALFIEQPITWAAHRQAA